MLGHTMLFGLQGLHDVQEMQQPTAHLHAQSAPVHHT